MRWVRCCSFKYFLGIIYMLFVPFRPLLLNLYRLRFRWRESNLQCRLAPCPNRETERIEKERTWKDIWRVGFPETNITALEVTWMPPPRPILVVMAVKAPGLCLRLRKFGLVRFLNKCRMAPFPCKFKWVGFIFRKRTLSPHKTILRIHVRKLHCILGFSVWFCMVLQKLRGWFIDIDNNISSGRRWRSYLT